MRKPIGLAVLAAVLAIGTSFTCRDAAATEGLGLDFGLLGGVTFPSATGASSRFGWGLEGDYQLLPTWTVGAFFLSSSQDQAIPAVGSSPAVSASTRISLYGVQSALKLGYPGLAVGARLGNAHNSTDVNNAGTTSTDSFAIGPYASWDYKFAPMWSVGADAGILFATGSSSYNVINLLASLKFYL
jgi:hypothetical protein